MERFDFDCDAFIRWLNRLEYPRSITLWAKAARLGTLTFEDDPDHYYNPSVDWERLRSVIQKQSKSQEEQIFLIEHYVSRVLLYGIPEHAVYNELVDCIWESVGAEFARQFVDACIKMSSVEDIFFTPDEQMLADYHRIKHLIFDKIHTAEPLTFFASTKDLDLEEAYEDVTPALVGINRSMLILLWIN